MSERTIPSFHGSINFNAQHAPMGAFMTFTCGHFGSGGGIGVEIGKPANQNIYIGVKRGDRRSPQPFRFLPFVRRSAFTSAAANFQMGQATDGGAAKPMVDCYDAPQIERRFGWASDTWATPDLSFAVYTPFGPIPEPSADPALLRVGLLPAVVARLTLNNRDGKETKTAVFALDFPECGTRLIRTAADDSIITAPAAPTKLGFAWRRNMGVLGMLATPASEGDDGFFAFQRWSVAEGVSDVNPAHELGSIGGLAIEAKPGEVRTLTLAIGVYLDGIVTTGLEAKYLYTRYFTSLEDVLSTALDRSADLGERAADLDDALLSSGLSADQQFLVAHGTRGYYAATQLLDVAGEAMFVVNEGEYCMMNTLDLAIDQVFWELQHNPWVVRSILDTASHRYSYHDQVRTRGGELLPGGIAFCHDMGVNNNFSRAGHSSYELAHLQGCFSYMSQEELCNWILLACCYIARTHDTKWLQQNADLLAACAASMRNRADPRTGVMTYDSARCRGGQEITTYDSLDASLGQARSNTYLAVKCWAAWVGLDMLRKMRDDAASDAGDADDSLADVLARFLSSCAGPDDVIPAVLEKDSAGYRSRTLPVVEALIYPHYWQSCLRGGDFIDAEQTVSSAMRAPLVKALRQHAVRLLTDPQHRNAFADGGIKLSSTSDNSWMSKIALVQHVAREVLRLHEHDASVDALFRAADAAHVRWQTEGAAYWACSDQFVNGVAKASRFYPRMITAALWLNETAGVTVQTIPVKQPTSAAAPK